MSKLQQIKQRLKNWKASFDEDRKELVQISMDLTRVLKEENISNLMLKTQAKHYWLDSVDRKFKILDEEIEKELKDDK